MFDALFETSTLILAHKIRPPPVLLVGENYRRKAIDIDCLSEESEIDSEDYDLCWYASLLVRWEHGIDHEPKR